METLCLDLSGPRARSLGPVLREVLRCDILFSAFYRQAPVTSIAS